MLLIEVLEFHTIGSSKSMFPLSKDLIRIASSKLILKKKTPEYTGIVLLVSSFRPPNWLLHIFSEVN